MFLKRRARKSIKTDISVLTQFYHLIPAFLTSKWIRAFIEGTIECLKYLEESLGHRDVLHVDQADATVVRSSQPQQERRALANLDGADPVCSAPFSNVRQRLITMDIKWANVL